VYSGWLLATLLGEVCWPVSLVHSLTATIEHTFAFTAALFVAFARVAFVISPTAASVILFGREFFESCSHGVGGSETLRTRCDGWDGVGMCDLLNQVCVVGNQGRKLAIAIGCSWEKLVCSPDHKRRPLPSGEDGGRCLYRDDDDGECYCIHLMFGTVAGAAGALFALLAFVVRLSMFCCPQRGCCCASPGAHCGCTGCSCLLGPVVRSLVPLILLHTPQNLLFGVAQSALLTRVLFFLSHVCCSSLHTCAVLPCTRVLFFLSHVCCSSFHTGAVLPFTRVLFFLAHVCCSSVLEGSSDRVSIVLLLGGCSNYFGESWEIRAAFT
jgi:hypothetical protein